MEKKDNSEQVDSKEELKKSKIDQLVKRYRLDLKKLESEQIRTASLIETTDKIDFKLADRFAAFENIFINNRLLSCVIVCNKDFEIIDQAYSFEKVNFPYIPGFRNYRELVPMINAFDKLSQKPDVIFISAQGIIHPRLGLASHFSLSIGGIPTIGVANSTIDAEIVDNNIVRNGKIIGKLLVSKEGSNPMFISPGNNITIESSYELCKTLIKPPHKRPEPLHLASKYSKEVRKEIISSV